MTREEIRTWVFRELIGTTLILEGVRAYNSVIDLEGGITLNSLMTLQGAMDAVVCNLRALRNRWRTENDEVMEKNFRA